MTTRNENDESVSSDSEVEEGGSQNSKSKKEKKKKKKTDETSEERRERRRLKKERKERRAQKKEKKERKEKKKIGEFSTKRNSKRNNTYEADRSRHTLQKSAETHGMDDEFMMVAMNERPKWEVWYRRILLLPANPELETPIKRSLRYLSWTMLLFDMTAAIVSLVTFGDITYCCDEPLLNMVGDKVNWAACVRGVIYVYLILLVLEIYPVVRQGFPFNVVNPLIGFVITFAVFFDDAKTEALIMWGLETMAVVCEFALYRLKVYQCKKRAIEIKELMPKTTRRVGDVFEDEEVAAIQLKTARRKFYVLRKEQAKDESMLRWLVFAVYLNFVLTSLVLILILVIARSGGLCFIDFKFPNPFAVDQIGNCYMCSERDILCNICTEETTQCYYPYS